MDSGKSLIIDGVQQFFGTKDSKVQALSRIDLVIEPGQFVCLAGPSGCGKTTLLRLVAGFMKPTEGTITVDGKAIAKPGPDRGMVFQSPTLYPWMTVRRNVELGPKFQGLSKKQRTAQSDRFLNMVGLADFADRHSYELSGGMQQRCQIARVLASEPEFILMDEPFGALDALTRERLQEELLTIWRETGRTILFITHSVEEAVFLGSRVLVMSRRPGEIVFDEEVVFGGSKGRLPVSELRSAPEFVAIADRVRDSIQGSM
jgi:ABC-type nitrate/sulfonate/bicarbonate transport system ATPase subunit